MQMQEHDLVQGSPEWHEHRARHFNAADAAAMLGVDHRRSRIELLDQYTTGIQPEFSDYVLERVIEPGHEFEALALPLAEEIIGQDLYPIVGTRGKLSASFDGLTMAQDIPWEHKRLNAELRAVMVPGCTGADLPMLFQVQMQQQCIVSGASRVLFMASEWDDEILIEERHCWYESNAALAQRILAGWEQFDVDLCSHVVQVREVKPVGAELRQLPALLVSVEGKVVSSNLEPYRIAAMNFIAEFKTTVESEQECADVEKQSVRCKESEDMLATVKAQAIAQTTSIEELFLVIDEISGQFRTKRLEGERATKAWKEGRRNEILLNAQADLDAHVATLNKRLGRNYLDRVVGGFAEAIKGKKSYDSMKAAVNGVLANAKIDASAKADRYETNFKAVVGDGFDWQFLFADFNTLGDKPVDDFKAIADSRIRSHNEAEQRRKDAAAAAEQKAAAPAALAAPPAANDAPPTPAPAPAPAPCVGFASAARRPVPAVVTYLNLTQLCDVLGVTVTAERLEVLGYPPAKREGKARLYRDCDVIHIGQVLAQHICKVTEAYGMSAAMAA